MSGRCITRARDSRCAVEIPEPVDERARQWFDVLPGDRTKQHKLQQLIVRHRRGTPGHEAIAQPPPMILDV
jgi:hypothetical protein